MSTVSAATLGPVQLRRAVRTARALSKRRSPPPEFHPTAPVLGGGYHTLRPTPQCNRMWTGAHRTGPLHMSNIGPRHRFESSARAVILIAPGRPQRTPLHWPLPDGYPAWDESRSHRTVGMLVLSNEGSAAHLTTHRCEGGSPGVVRDPAGDGQPVRRGGRRCPAVQRERSGGRGVAATPEGGFRGPAGGRVGRWRGRGRC